jgi:hypothetical protein
MLEFEVKKKGHLNIYNDSLPILYDFKSLTCPFGTEDWCGKTIINLELDKSNEGYNIMNDIQFLENQIVTFDKIENIDLKYLKWTSIIKNDKLLRLNVTDPKYLNLKPNDIVSGKIMLSKIWIYKNIYGLYATLESN